MSGRDEQPAFLTTSASLRRGRPLSLRGRTLLRGAALRALTSLPHDEPEPGVRIVHLHWVFDDDRAAFAAQLDFLADAFEPVSLSEAVRRLVAGEVSGRELTITFDDGFRNQLQNGTEILRERGFSACFFLISDLVDAPERVVRRICADRLHMPGPVEPLSWADAERLLALGHEIGSHTCSHPDLASLGSGELHSELERSRHELERRLGPVVHFSAPYGDAERFPARVSDVARAAGYASCASAQRGVNRGPADVYALRRHHLEPWWPVKQVRWFLR